MHNLDISQPDQSQRWSITEEHVGTRLDRFLVLMLVETSRTTVQQLISDGEILVNGRASKPGYALREGDEVEVIRSTPTHAANTVTPQLLPLDIIYEDNDLLVINK